MSFKDKFFALLDGLDAPASADQEETIVPDTHDHQPAPAAPPLPSAPVGGAQASIEMSALTERMAAMEAELVAAKALTESQEAALQAVTAQNAQMAREARAKRFADEVMGKSAASGVRWVGAPEQHVALLEHLADSAGEDSELFASYVTQQRALGEQMRSSDLMREVGSGRGGSTGGDAMARLTSMAAARVSEGKAASHTEAMAQLEREQPGLFAEYRESITRRI